VAPTRTARSTTGVCAATATLAPTATATLAPTATLTTTAAPYPAPATAAPPRPVIPQTRRIAYTYDGLQRLTGATETPGTC
jgi:hypothetical protein